jgi:hypothetical protein
MDRDLEQLLENGKVCQSDRSLVVKETTRTLTDQPYIEREMHTSNDFLLKTLIDFCFQG